MIDPRQHYHLMMGLFILLYLLPVLLVGYLAYTKGRLVTAWLLVTFFTGILGVAILALLPPTAARKRKLAAAALAARTRPRTAYDQDQFDN